MYPFHLMANILHVIQIVSALALIALVLLQQNSGDMGSSMSDTSFFRTRRGSERFLFILTIILALAFVGSSIAIIVG